MAARRTTPKLLIPDQPNAALSVGARNLELTNLDKFYWPKCRTSPRGITKRELLQYYADISPYLLPHLCDRAMVMKRYPNGSQGEFFFMKRAPSPRPSWLKTCSIKHSSGSVIDFPMIQDLASLLWAVNLGCIDLNPWYARCDDPYRPDYLHFDLDPTPGATFQHVRETALVVDEALKKLKMKAVAKTTGSRGIHLYVAIKRGPLQKEVWSFAKALAFALAAEHPKLITAEYRIAKRPRRHVLVDYNQNAWGRTLASVYSVRPKPKATVSAPVTMEEVEAGIAIDDFTMFNMPERLRALGDLWSVLNTARGRFNLERYL